MSYLTTLILLIIYTQIPSKMKKSNLFLIFSLWGCAQTDMKCSWKVSQVHAGDKIGFSKPILSPLWTWENFPLTLHISFLTAQRENIKNKVLFTIWKILVKFKVNVTLDLFYHFPGPTIVQTFQILAPKISTFWHHNIQGYQIRFSQIFGRKISLLKSAPNELIFQPLDCYTQGSSHFSC